MVLDSISIYSFQPPSGEWDRLLLLPPTRHCLQPWRLTKHTLCTGRFPSVSEACDCGCKKPRPSAMAMSVPSDSSVTAPMTGTPNKQAIGPGVRRADVAGDEDGGVAPWARLS